MEKKYYAVETKCGHVGRGKYTIITFAISAENGKEAAKIGRWMPRVKHHHKFCILSVKEITYDEYLVLFEENKNNPYLQCESIQDQNAMCPNIYFEIYDLYNKEDKVLSEEKRNARVLCKLRKNKARENYYNNYFKYDASYGGQEVLV